MTDLSILHPALLFAAAGLSAWAAVLARSRSATPGLAPFVWLMIGIAHWSLTSGLHATVPSYDVRIGISMLQYVGIAAVPPLFLLFASEYARARWTADATLRGLLWLIPAVTVVVAFTNPWHGLLWQAVVPVPGGRLRYDPGPWFWVAASYAYALMFVATVLLARALTRYPLPHRRQTMLIATGALLPWVGNLAYLLRLLPPGIDPTPLAFAASGSCILWGMQRHRLLGVVPIARDLVIESMEDAVFVLDGNRVIVDLNPSARRLTGRGEDAVGLSIDEAVPWWSAAGADGAGTDAHPAVVTLEPGPRQYEVDVTAVTDPHARFAGWLVRIRDVTARLAGEADRRALEQRMQERQRLESLTVLAGGVAHDFNNILTGILGNADLVAMQAAPGSALRRTAEAIVLDAHRAADLVSQMLAYAGEGQVVAEVIDLDALVTEALDLLQASVARHCTLIFASEGSLPPIKADAAQVRQIFLNLIANAAEAVADGATIDVRTGAAALTAGDLARMTFAPTASAGIHVWLEVRDPGPGMDASTLARVFDPFFSTKATGRGLGLAAVQGIVRGHRGAIDVTSSPSDGTRFRIWLPATTADAAARPARPADVSEPSVP
ncbi:MAG: histidine kinase N-terminal 7TM domain-containing protein [Acidobacteriota bacterium]